MQDRAETSPKSLSAGSLILKDDTPKNGNSSPGGLLTEDQISLPCHALHDPHRVAGNVSPESTLAVFRRGQCQDG